MADAGSSIFNEQSRNRLQSPDDLDRYIRVTSPSVWVVLGAVIALVMGLLAWGIFDSVSTTITAYLWTSAHEVSPLGSLQIS